MALAPNADQDKYLGDLNPYYVLYYVPRRRLSAPPRDIISQIAGWANNHGTPNILCLHAYPGAGNSVTGIASTLVQQLNEAGRLDEIFAQFNARPETRISILWRLVSYELARRFAVCREVVVERLKARESRLANRSVSSRLRGCRLKRKPPTGGLVGLVESLQELWPVKK